MKASELRIGNFVMWGKEHKELKRIGSIDEINEDARVHSLLIPEKGCGDFFHSFLKDLYPIPLTEEWLLKFGYQYANENGQKFYWHVEMPYFQLRKYEDSWLLWYLEDHIEALISKMEIDHVHHLQNIFYYLTDEELTIQQ